MHQSGRALSDVHDETGTTHGSQASCHAGQHDRGLRNDHAALVDSELPWELPRTRAARLLDGVLVVLPGVVVHEQRALARVGPRLTLSLAEGRGSLLPLLAGLACVFAARRDPLLFSVRFAVPALSGGGGRSRKESSTERLLNCCCW